MTIYTVQLLNGTVGTLDSDTLYTQCADEIIGEWLTVLCHDENGNPIGVSGIVDLILEENY